ncbi:sulfite exporter TauE/SafE family protein [Mycobacterium sp. SMC-4]|uniref:sulfite exporter TauE/SafE family protein n=1 Tax=Mycobacterium sp. SMC-4 TaxID=2857059 RepID=UPI003CFD28D7
MSGVSWSHALLLVAAGVLGGLTGSIAGLASVATYPALLLVGLPPVSANVTNTTALVFNGIGSIAGSRPELAGQRAQLRRLVPVAVAGGVAGAALLLSTPAEGFEKLVPVLLGGASMAILVPVRPRPAAQVSARRRRTTVLATAVAIFAVCIYGGYFGAAAGVLLLAVLLRVHDGTLAEANAGKNVVLGIANAVAAVIFAIVAPVRWDAVLVLGLGCLAGSRLGPVIVRHAPAGPMRVAIGVAGLALAVRLGWDAYR